MSFFLSFTFAHSSASDGASLRSTMGFQVLASSAFSLMNSRCSGGTSSSANIASTGHSGMQSVQSMHSSGSITSMFGPSRKQSTGHTSTQSVYLHLMHDSVMMYAIWEQPGSSGNRPRMTADFITPARDPPISVPLGCVRSSLSLSLSLPLRMG